MLFTTSTIAFMAALLPATLAAPMQKRMTGVTIQSGRIGTCLSLPSNDQIADGLLLTTLPCDKATKWDINFGSGSVVVTGTSFALDAGVPQGNNARAKVWTSYPGSPQQTWYLTNDNRIAITGGNQCLDQGDNGPQTYQCTTGNTNQIWYVGNGGGSAPSSTSSVAPSSTSSSSPPSQTLSGKQFTWKADTSKCVTVGNPPADGQTVSLEECASGVSDTARRQRFEGTRYGGIRMTGTNYCLDAQSYPSNGGQLQVYTCVDTTPQQHFTDPAPGLYQTSNNQCIDVDNADNRHMQTWQCSSNDPQQLFNFY